MTRSLKKLPSIISAGENKKTIIADIQDYFGMGIVGFRKNNQGGQGVTAFFVYFLREPSNLRSSPHCSIGGVINVATTIGMGWAINLNFLFGIG